MAVFFLVVAGLNLVLGFALGVYLAQYVDGAIPPLAPAARQETAPPQSEKLPEPPAPAVEAVSAPPAAPIEAVAPVVPVPEPVAPAAVKPEPAVAVVEPTAEAIGASIAGFKAELSRYRDQLSSLDKQMRAGAETQDAAQIKECLTTLRSANDKYLEQQTDAALRFQQHCNTPELEPINRQLGTALDKQAAQVKISNENLADVDLEQNLLMTCQQLLDETSRLVDANHAVRDAVDDIELQMERRGDLPVEADGPPADPVHNLISRAQLEATLARFWEQDPKREQPMSVGLVDLDRFRDLNEAHGLNVGDRILDAVAQVVGGVVHGEQRAVRMSALQFLLMLPGVSAREATNVLERIRQHVEATRFECSSGSIAVTVSCAVADSRGDDTLPTLLARAEATLQEAKRYGRNRTFLHDGKFPAPVVPPVLPVESRKLAV